MACPSTKATSLPTTLGFRLKHGKILNGVTVFPLRARLGISPMEFYESRQNTAFYISAINRRCSITHARFSTNFVHTKSAPRSTRAPTTSTAKSGPGNCSCSQRPIPCRCSSSRYSSLSVQNSYSRGPAAPQDSPSPQRCPLAPSNSGGPGSHLMHQISTFPVVND